ncbi:hypothetical protein ACLB2K_075971 [Fragaria x ananassa]
MRSLAGTWVLPNCSKVSIFNGNLSSSRFGSDTQNCVVFKSSAFVAAAASVSGSGAQYSGSEGLLGVQTKKKSKGIAGIDQDELVEDPKLLADPDSCFCEFSGVEIHHKVCEAQLEVHDESESVSSEVKSVGLPMILLHGFGASVFSWNRVMKPLAEAVGSKVLAFDRPAFGLTSRGNSVRELSSGNGESKPVNPYSMAFSVLATLYFIDFLAAEKAIIVGHSAGSLVAVESYFEAPERVAALILVAPAIFAPIIIQKVVKGSQPGTNDQTEGDSNSVDDGNPFVQFSKVLSKIARYISQAIMGLVKGMAVMLNSLYKRFLSALLRSTFAIMLVRMAINKFGITAVRNAWYDSKKVTDEDISGYTKVIFLIVLSSYLFLALGSIVLTWMYFHMQPLRTKGWDKALVEYTAAMLTDTSSESKPPLAKRLRDIKCPVLIVTGDNDRIVPSWNAERLSKAIPGSCFEVMKHCGHLPHEEKVDEFLSVVKKFLQSAFDDSPQERLQVI